MNKKGIYDAKFVTTLFNEMSKTYGTVNSISSFGFCYFWREQCADLLEYSDGQVIVDLMSGMAELCITINKRNKNLAFKSIDLSPSMSEMATSSVTRHKLKSCAVMKRDALETQLPSNSVDAVVSTFGLKTFSQKQTDQLATEASRILKPGGQVAFLEISIPNFALLRIPYLFYLRFLIPIIGRLFMGNAENYKMLGVYTENFQNCNRAIDAFTNAGFEIQPKQFFFGCATGFTGKKPCKK